MFPLSSLMIILSLLSLMYGCSHREFYGKNEVVEEVKLTGQNIACLKRGYEWTWSEGSCRIKNFLDYCLEKKAPDDIVRTVNFIKNDLEKKDCEDAWQILNKSKGIYLSGYAISNIYPLYGLESLQFLRLDENKIRDLFPLRSLKNLVVLRIDKNIIDNIEHLNQLKKLIVLRLDENRVKDLSPLKGIATLVRLNANKNLIQDLSPLSGLPQLKKLGLRGNNISDASALRSLKHLSYLDLRDTPLDQNRSLKSESTCPTTPDTPAVLKRFCEMSGREAPQPSGGRILKSRGE